MNNWLIFTYLAVATDCAQTATPADVTTMHTKAANAIIESMFSLCTRKNIYRTEIQIAQIDTTNGDPRTAVP